MKLYHSPGACSMAVHIVLEELGLKYEMEKVDLKAPRTAEYLRTNPKGYVPAMKLTNGDVLTEASVIMQYLADQKPEKWLMPTMGTWDRYKAMELLNFISTEIHKGFGPLWAIDSLSSTDEGKAQIRQVTLERLGKRFDLLNERLEDEGPYLMGRQFTVADAYLFTILSWSKIHELDLAKWPKLGEFMEAVSRRPAVRAVMAQEFGSVSRRQDPELSANP